MSHSPVDSHVWVVIPAAGVGSRMGTDIPKQYLRIRSKTILEHTISRFLALDSVAGVLVMVGVDDTHWPGVNERLSKGKGASRITFAYGGSERSDTVAKALDYLVSKIGLDDSQWVMVHDAARPCVRVNDVLKLLEVRSLNSGGGILAVPAKDTMKRATPGNNMISHTESRDGLWHALTPQLFRLRDLSDALKTAQLSGGVVTDEASAMEFVGQPVALIEGASDNIKLTTPGDLSLVAFLLEQMEKGGGPNV